MSDFLKKFSKQEYQKVKKIDFSTEKNDDEEKETKIVKDESTEETKDEKHAIFQTSNTKEEVYEQDREKIEKRKKNILIAIICTLIVMGIGFFAFHKLNEVRVPQFVEEKTLNDVQLWAAKNKIEVTYTSVFSTSVNDGYVVKQSKKAGSILQKGSHFEIILSKGADPQEHIKLPDFMKMTLTEIEDWKEKNKAVNVTIEKVFDEKIKKGKTIRVEYKTEGIDANSYRRKDKLNIVVSKGKETYEKNIEVPDFVKHSKAEVEAWAKENDVEVKVEEVASNKFAEGMVITQNIPAKTKIAKKDVIIITVSKGRISYVPNFAGLDETQAQIEATKANVIIQIVPYYSNNVQANQLIAQSLPAGMEIKDQSVVLQYSLGKPYIANFDGEDVYTMTKSIDEMNGKGARLTYELIYVSSGQKKGSIVRTNYSATFVNVGTHIQIYISKGE